MNQKKNRKIIIILIIVVILIISILGISLAYFSTDIFKSNKELFFKYASQIADEEDGFIDKQLSQYLEKKKNTPYENDGTFSADISSERINQTQQESVNNFNVSFSGQVDNASSKVNQNISINYSDSVKFPISYKKTEDTIGLQTKYVGSKFIAVETDNLSDISRQLDSSIKSTVNLGQQAQNLSDIELSEEDKNHIKEIYTNFLNTQLDASKFTAVETIDSKGYKLSLKGEDIKTLLKSFLENLKNDQTTIDKINEYMQIQKSSSKISQNSIDNMIKDIDDSSSFDDENLEITVYAKNKKTNKIEISINEMKLTIEKIQTGNDLQYNISVDIYDEENKSISVYLNSKYTGLQLLQSISENYEVGISSDDDSEQYKYYFNNNINFNESSNIGELTEDNAIILNDYSTDEVNSFVQAIYERIAQVNKKQMKKIGLEEDENPIQYLIPNFIFYDSTMSAIENQEEIDETEITSFNEKFEMYEGTNQKGVTVKGLLTVINSNNTMYEDTQIEEIHFNGEEYEATEQNITLIKSEVETEESYRVEFEKDSDTGRIYRAVINKR